MKMRKEENGYFRKFNEPSYDQKIWLVIEPDRAVLAQKIHKRFGVLLEDSYRPANGSYFNIDSPDLGKIHFLWLSQFDWNIGDQGLLHHELLHMTCEVMRIVGIDLCRESEEAYTHFHQKLVMEALHCLKDQHPQVKKHRKKSGDAAKGGGS